MPLQRQLSHLVFVCRDRHVARDVEIGAERLVVLAAQAPFGAEQDPQINNGATVRLGLAQEIGQGLRQRHELLVKHGVDQEGWRSVGVSSASQRCRDDSGGVGNHDCLIGRASAYLLGDLSSDDPAVRPQVWTLACEVETLDARRWPQLRSEFETEVRGPPGKGPVAQRRRDRERSCPSNNLDAMKRGRS